MAHFLRGCAAWLLALVFVAAFLLAMASVLAMGAGIAAAIAAGSPVPLALTLLGVAGGGLFFAIVRGCDWIANRLYL